MGCLLLLAASGCVPLGGAIAPPVQGPVGPPGAGAVGAYYSHFNDAQASELAPKLAAVLDENKVLLGRLQEAQLLLSEKEQGLVLARGEIQMATEEAARSRQEIERCRQEMTRLVEQMRKGDKDSQAALHEMVNLLDVLLQQRDHAGPHAPIKQKEPAVPGPEPVVPSKEQAPLLPTPTAVETQRKGE